MERLAVQRRYAKLHDARPWHDGEFKRWSAEETSGTPYRFDDGVVLYVAEKDQNPSDDFLAAPALLGDDSAGLAPPKPAADGP